MARPDVDLRVWGRDRPGYIRGLSAVDVIRHLYGDGYPDVVIVHSSMEKHKDAEDVAIFKGMETISKHCTVVWRTFDCFPNKIGFYTNQIRKYKPSLVLVWYPGQVKELYKATGARVHFFPHAVGRRYYNKNCNRPYDIGLIGRCEHKGSPLTTANFGKLKAFVPPRRKTRLEKGNNLINNLNLCRFSWNSPVLNKHTSLRFVEAPACGTISLIPGHFKELDAYFPPDTYVICNSMKGAIRTIKRMPVQKYLRIQQQAYQHVMTYHTMDSRISYLMDLIRGREGSPFDYKNQNI